MKKILFVIKKSKKTGKFYYSIVASNGNNLDPSDLQKNKVKRAVVSLIRHIENGAYDIVDSTQKVGKAKK